jgi:hypothetical protein
MQASGVRLVNTLDRIAYYGLGAATPLDPAQRRLAFVTGFVDEVAGRGGTFADAAVRKAAAQAAEQLLNDQAIRQAIDAGADDGLSIPRDLFCAVYRMFFAHAVEQFLTTVIAEGATTFLVAHVPVLPAIDPGGQIAEWIAQDLVAMLPTPCKDPAATGPSLADLPHSLLSETVDRALGLPLDGGMS